ncbi:type II toxin-antitoxin system HicB family antitoxin [Paraburkholderia sp.]|uniref:type II toxin-antitoxin system HicB family antitoxin n=1 Tax=Paraburkholderia sp. TaxID=1926495 RepID=UPI00239BAEDC|nr:type II toxin-antitoxin system HicB family antitoxin [Paraburkholderia sp.]MDE1181241.1 type II toxin-antitoxin system HicB family antitoxin [Paraburkholderia sp.]
MKNIIYPIAIEPGDDHQAWGVVVPDIPGCFSAGDSFEDAFVNAKEAIESHLDTLFDEGLPLPAKRPLAGHRANPDYAGWVWGFVAVRDIVALKKAVRINISLPEVLLTDIDEYAKARGMTRSAFLALAAEHEMAAA